MKRVDRNMGPGIHGRVLARPAPPLAALAAALGALCLLLAPGGAPLAESPEDILVVANNALAVNSVSAGELKDIFLKKRVTLGGDKVVPLNAPEGSAARKLFRKRVLGLSAQEEELFWVTEQVKTGSGKPVEFSNTLKAVFKLKGGISYVLRSDYVKGVGKILLVIPG